MNDLVLPIITELCPKPSSGSEWVELYNPSEESINLTQWQVWDQLSQPSLLYSFTDFTLAPHSFVVIEVGKKLNDTGDGVIVLDADKNVIDSASYQTAQPDLGYARTNLNTLANFEWQPISPNSFVIPTILPTPSFPTATITSTPPNEISPSVTTFIPTRTPTPSRTLTPTKIPTPSKTPSPTSKPMTISEPSPTSTVPIPANQPFASPHPPNIPSLRLQTNLVNAATQTSSLSSTASQLNQPPTHNRMVHFPLATNPMAAQNVIIGGFIICFQAGVTVWQDWKKQQQDTYF